MTTDNWISLIAAILVGGGTLFLGIMAWRTIYQTRNIQKAEKREGSIKEFIDWNLEVIDFTAGETSLTSKDIMDIVSLGMPFETIKKTIAQRQHVKLNRLSSKCMYLLPLRAQIFPDRDDLNIALHKVRRKIYEHLSLLTLETQGKVKNDEKATHTQLARLLQEATVLMNVLVNIYEEIK